MNNKGSLVERMHADFNERLNRYLDVEAIKSLLLEIETNHRMDHAMRKTFEAQATLLLTSMRNEVNRNFGKKMVTPKLS